MIDQPLSTIDAILENMYLNNAGIIIVNDSGSIVYEPTAALINEHISYISPSLQHVLQGRNGSFSAEIGGERWLVTFYASAYSGWRFVSLLPYTYIISDSLILRYATAIVCVVCFFIILALTSVTARRITKPVRELQSGMSEVGNGNFDFTLPVTNHDELGELTLGFNHMQQKIKGLIQSEYEAKLGQNEAELNALRSQINPHFLYNTLESIRAHAALNDDPEVAEMIYSLASLFRMSMKRGKIYEKLGNEIELVNYYVEIQKMRFKFSVVYDIPEELHHFEIPSFIIQPLMENAICHGIEQKDDPGNILLKARTPGTDTLVIEITDNGIGMEEEALKQLNANLCRGIPYEAPQSNGHIGLSNINARIHKYAKHPSNKYGLQIRLNDHGGVTAKLTLPV